MINVKYFAYLREHLGLSEESIAWENQLATVADLKSLLSQRDAIWRKTLGDTSLQVAVNQAMAFEHSPIVDGDEIAFFPPVTGG